MLEHVSMSITCVIFHQDFITIQSNQDGGPDLDSR